MDLFEGGKKNDPLEIVLGTTAAGQNALSSMSDCICLLRSPKNSDHFVAEIVFDVKERSTD